MGLDIVIAYNMIEHIAVCNITALTVWVRIG
jgi:hypothetical protein